MSTRRSIGRFPFHPLLFGVHAVLSFYASNIGQAAPEDMVRSLIVVLAVVLVTQVLLWRMLKNNAKAAAVITLGVILFFTYDLYSLYSVQLILITVLVNWLVYFIVKSDKDWSVASLVLNVAACVALILPMWTVAQQALTRSGDETKMGVALQVETLGADVERPNIYYIILDGYGRADVLEDMYQYPANTFMDMLRSEGFYIAEKSRSNYVRTIFSLASSFNMDTLEAFIAENHLRGTHDENVIELYNYHNRLVKLLTELGYSTVGTNSGYLGWNKSGMANYEPPAVGALNEFELKLLGQTPVHEFLRDLQLSTAFDTHRARQVEVLERIPEMAAEYSNPTFVFAHVLMPHPPFVFDAEGNAIVPGDPNFHIGDADSLVNVTMTIQEYQKSYAGQLHHLNRLLMGMVQRLKKADPGCVIILQGDHGPGSQYVGNSLEKTNMHERTAILNAFFFPDGDYAELYPEITPANTFRVISNHFFKTEYPLVADTSYFSSTASAYDFTAVEFDE